MRVANLHSTPAQAAKQERCTVKGEQGNHTPAHVAKGQCAYEGRDILDGLEVELAFARQPEKKLLDEACQAVTGADDDTPLMVLPRNKIKKLLRNKNLGHAKMRALRWFLQQYKRLPWMQWQNRGHYPERIGISLLANWMKATNMAYCGYAGRRCKEPDHCPRCACRDRIKYAQKEYENVYGSTLKDGTRLYCYAISPSFEWRAARAGLHFVTKKADRKRGIPAEVEHWHPWTNHPDAQPLTADDDAGGVNPVRQCFRLIFDFARALRSCSVRGVLAHRHFAWHFFEKEGYPHHITPNGHFLVMTEQPLTVESGRLMLELFKTLRRKRTFGRRLYPDLHIEELTSQADVNRWIYYMLEPMDYVGPYINAIRRGVDPATLNYEVDGRVFQAGEVILSVSSPHRFGVLRSNGNGYIGTMSVTEQRNQEAQEGKAKRAKKERPPSPADNHLHHKAKLLDLIQHEGDWEP